MEKVFLHVDLDAFFASVEQLDNPEYRGKPVIVGGLPGDRRSVVSTASYEARKFGVHSAMPTFQAVKLCPNGIFVRPNMRRYHEKSEEVMAIFKEYSPDIQQISVDEAFIDLTGTERLFGAPEETARRLKKEVLEKTGLTVSVGLASTKYCAKIASGLQKPDGLTIVPSGKETDFMLSLPLTKVWGAGKKTLEKLENYGIKTTADIYSRSEKLLQSLFGNAAGSFLYNAVRGNEGADFRAEPKSRSISSENTYEFDLTDTDTIETAILYLCHTVMFRSLREKVRSTSVSLKIRYEDFSTVSVQETSERYISSVDDLFERAKNLFLKKRDSRLGIRLLGVSMQNLEDDTTPRQQELFDFGDEKKRRLENAILKAQEKDPALKITKARLLKGSLSFLLLFLIPVQYVKAETVGETLEVVKTTTNTEKEADGAAGIVFDTSRLPLSDSGNFVSLFNQNFGDGEAQNIEFYASGYWKSTVTGGAVYSFGFGNSPILSTSSPVFTQNVDLSLYFMLNHHWYFEAAFADEFTKNTVAAGYIGDGYLKSARISNRKIVFPSIYSVDKLNRGIGGGENQAPGISFNWKGENWQADTAIRYELLEAHEKSWYGKNAVSTNEIALSSYNTGNEYILPSSSLVQNVKDIYVESSGGTYKDSKGRKYKKLDESQYLLLSSQNLILLSKDAKAGKKSGVLPSVAVTFYGSVTQSDFGTFDDENTFLGKVKKWFSETDIKNYVYTLFNSIDGEDCLFLQHPGGFSPFAVASRYDAGSVSATDAQIAYSSTGTAETTYRVVIDEDNLRFSETDFFYSNHLYAEVSIAEDDENLDSLDKLIHSAFPLAKTKPKVYLGLSSNEDLCLQVRTFTPVNRLEIGTEAVAGTITVYKNGIIDGSASYDSESGTINLSTAVSSSDHIKVSWYEESEDSESGSLAAAGGFKYDFTEKISADLSTSARWSWTPERKFADSSYASRGFGTLATNVSYSGENLFLSNTAGATYENTNTTGLYRILGDSKSDTETYYFSKTAGIDLPSDFAPTLNEKNSSGEISHTELKSEKNGSVDFSDGKTDSSISGYAIPLEWDFSGLTADTGENQAWASLSLYTPGIASSLSNAGTFSIAIKNPLSDENFDTSKVFLYLQLGVSDDDDFSLEESEKIPTWKISDSTSEQIKNAFDFSESSWQTVTVSLSDEERSIISSLRETNARIILTTSDTSSLPSSGTFFLGPYETGELTYTFETSSDAQSQNYEITDTSLSSSKVKKFNFNSTNTVQYFEWDFPTTQTEERELKFSRTFTEIDLSEYKKLSFFLKGENVTSLTLTLSRPKSSGEEKAVVYTLTNTILSSEWKEYTIDLTGGTNSNLTYINTDVVPTKITLTVLTKENGNLYFDELYLSENTPFVVLQDKVEAGYKIEGSILETENFEILKDFKISATGDGASSFETEKGNQKEKSLQSTGNISFTLTNLKIAGSTSLSNSYKAEKTDDITQKNPLSSGSHSIQTEKPIFNALSFSENYVYSASDGSLEKANSFKIDFTNLFLPLTIEGNTKATSDIWSLSQNSSAKSELKIKNLTITASGTLSQKILTDSASSEGGEEKFETINYASSYKKISEFSFDTGKDVAAKRNAGGNAKLSYDFKKAKLKPAVFLETSGSYKSSSKITFTDTTKSGFDIPFSIHKNNFSFSWKKSAGSVSLIEQGGNYERDTRELSNSLSEKSYYFKAFPVYDLVSGTLSQKVYEHNAESNFYTGSYSFTWKRAFFANKYDFFIPQSAKLEATRDIRTGTSTADFYQIKNTLNYTAINIFGRNGNLPLFSFFSSDEYNSSFSASVKIPREKPENYSYILSGYVQATYFFSQSNYLKNGLEGSYEGNEDWKAKYTLIWKRNSKSSLAKGIVSIFSTEKASKVMRITKTDSFNAATSIVSPTSSTGKPVKKYNIAYSHATETQVSKYVSLNTEAGLSYYANWEKTAALNATATIGATIKF